MGGRGAGLDVKKYLGWSHERRISEYETIHADGNIKFIMQKHGDRTSIPIFSNTEGRIYVTINSEGKISGITQYDANHKQVFTINEPHSLDKRKEVHMHSSIETGRKIIYWDDMPKKYQDLYLSIKQKYTEFDIFKKLRSIKIIMQDKNIKKYNELDNEFFSTCSNWTYTWKIGSVSYCLTWDFEMNEYRYGADDIYLKSFKDVYEALDGIIINNKTLRQLILETDFDFDTIN